MSTRGLCVQMNCFTSDNKTYALHQSYDSFVCHRPYLSPPLPGVVWPRAKFNYIYPMGHREAGSPGLSAGGSNNS